MPPPAIFALHLVDPRGRCDRRGFLTAAGVLLALQAPAALLLWHSGAGFGGLPVVAANAVFCWIGYAVISKRLHDLGRSAWWMPIGLLAWLIVGMVAALAVAIVAGPHVLEPGAAGYWLTLIALLLPLLGGLLWLHVARGQAGSNRFGPVPAPHGFSMPPA
jgi:uncharacterized membrane protein YhaH (DUF805 family)